MEDRLDRWLRRLAAVEAPAIPARDLYAGDHWRVSLELADIAAARGFRPTLWVISAGYGLIESAARVHPYSAAFSPGHPDSVLHRDYPGSVAEGFARWWVGMANWVGPGDGRAPRTIADLTRRHPRATFVVIASELYLNAVRADLIRAAEMMGSRATDAMVIVSAGTKEFGPLADNAVPLDARMQAVLGGARRSLNVRMARSLLSRMRPGVGWSAIRAQCARELEKTEPCTCAPGRPKCSDEDVMQFIRRALRDRAGFSGQPSATAMLRQFREDEGRACEQKRFSRLFHQVREVGNV